MFSTAGLSEARAAEIGVRRNCQGARLRLWPPPTAALAKAAKKQPSTGDNYAGTERKAAKLSKAQGPTKAFSDLGYVDGKSIQLEHRFPAEQPDQALPQQHGVLRDHDAHGSSA